MRSIVAILLASLLLCHWLGLTLVVHGFEGRYRQASPSVAGDEWLEVKLPLALPYAQPWAEPEGREGLLEIDGQFYNIMGQRYENDTLYTTLKTNLGAREQFSQLSDQINGLLAGQPESAPDTDGAAKWVKDGFKVYVSFAGLAFVVADGPGETALAGQTPYTRSFPTSFPSLSTPPPRG
jgi:hypothetical protein